MSKSIYDLAKEYGMSYKPVYDETARQAYLAGYKQRSDELIDLLVELEEYFEKRQDAEPEGENMEMRPNKEMWFYGQIKELLDKL